MKHIVLVGGGHSHAFVLKSCGLNPFNSSEIKVTLVSNCIETPYSGMLPGHIAGHYTRKECHLNLEHICKFGNVNLVLGQVHGVDREKKLVYSSWENQELEPIPYDVLSIDIGSSPNLSGAVKKDESTLNVTPVKPISTFSKRWDAILETVKERCKSNTKTTIGVVGAGAGGVELTLAMQYRLLQEAKKLVKNGDELIQFILFSRNNVVCSSHNRKVQRKMLRILKERKVMVKLNCEVSGMEGNSILTKSSVPEDQKIMVDDCIWCTMASAQPWIAESGFDVDDGGFLKVDDNLQSLNTPNVFAVGDIAHMVNQPRPKAGVFAVRQGPPVTKNIRAAIVGAPLSPYVAQKSFMGLLMTGTPYGVMSKGNMALEGKYLWKLKDYIDRKFMGKFSNLTQ